jgi:hypothetical protein
VKRRKPARGQQPSTVPCTVIEQQLTDTGNRLNIGAQPAEADVAGAAVGDLRTSRIWNHLRRPGLILCRSWSA